MSPALRQRWALRRSEAVEAVRSALESGDLSGEELSLEACDTLAQLLHKLAGTAGMFGEARLGERAGEFERALRQPMAADVLQGMAYDLLDVAGEADSPHARTGT